jgi:hypothetical protein
MPVIPSGLAKDATLASVLAAVDGLEALATAIRDATLALTKATDDQLVHGAVTVSDGSGPITVDGTVAISNPTTNPETGLAKDATLTSGNVKVSDQRGLVERMLARSPATGYHLWLDVTSSDPTRIYVAEAPDGTAAATVAFRGSRVTLDASGKPLGAVETASGFAWADRAAATWAS